MARTKPTEALPKILRAVRIHLRQLKSNPEFQHDFKQLEAIAKRLAQAPSPLIPVSELSKLSGKDLLPTADEKAFHDLAERFTEKWRFRPRWTPDGSVELFTRSPVSWETKEINGKRSVTWKLNEEWVSFGDLVSLATRYRNLRKRRLEKKGQRQQRRRLDTAALKLKARELKAHGKTPSQIAQALFPREYEDALKMDPNAREKLLLLASKYMDPPHNLTWPEAEKKAASEIGLDLRPPSVKLHNLTEKVRYLLKPSPLQK